MHLDPWPVLVSMLNGTASEPPAGWPRERVRVVMDGHLQTRSFNRQSPSPQRAKPLPPMDAELLRLMQRRGPITGSEVADALRLHYPVACERLHRLRLAGLVSHDGHAWNIVKAATSVG